MRSAYTLRLVFVLAKFPALILLYFLPSNVTLRSAVLNIQSARKDLRISIILITDFALSRKRVANVEFSEWL